MVSLSRASLVTALSVLVCWLGAMKVSSTALRRLTFTHHRALSQMSPLLKNPHLTHYLSSLSEPASAVDRIPGCHASVQLWLSSLHLTIQGEGSVVCSGQDIELMVV